MSVKHIFLAILVTLIWGVNFSVIKIGLYDIPPLMLVTIRFILVVLPAIFFVKKPSTSLSNLAMYGLLMFSIQFGLLFTGIHYGMSAGLASLVLQAQIIFTSIFALLMFKEPIYGKHIIGSLLAIAGLVIVALNIGGDVSVLGFLLTILASMSWAMGNIVSKKIKTEDVIGLIVWGSLFASVPLGISSLILESDYWHLNTFYNMSMLTIGCICFIVYPVTFFGFSVWSKLLNLYPASLVTPFTLLVPVFGIIVSNLIFNEVLYLWKLVALLLVLAGIAILLYGDKIGHSIFTNKGRNENS